MKTAKWCNNNLNSGCIRFKDVCEEVKELIQAKSISNIQEEIGDVLYFIYCWLYSKLGINLPMIGAMGSVRKFKNRIYVWKLIFKDAELEFNTKYLSNGSNYTKEEKLNLALDLARRDQGKDVN